MYTVTNLRQTTVQGKLPLIRTSPFHATGTFSVRYKLFHWQRKTTTLCQTITPVSWWYLCTQVHWPKNRICDKPLLQTIITSPLLIYIFVRLLFFFYSKQFSCSDTWWKIYLKESFLNIFFFIKSFEKKNGKKNTYMVLKSLLNFFSFQKYLYHLRVLQNLFENIL